MFVAVYTSGRQGDNAVNQAIHVIDLCPSTDSLAWVSWTYLHVKGNIDTLHCRLKWFRDFDEPRGWNVKGTVCIRVSTFPVCSTKHVAVHAVELTCEGFSFSYFRSGFRFWYKSPHKSGTVQDHLWFLRGWSNSSVCSDTIWIQGRVVILSDCTVLGMFPCELRAQFVLYSLLDIRFSRSFKRGSFVLGFLVIRCCGGFRLLRREFRCVIFCGYSDDCYDITLTDETFVN